MKSQALSFDVKPTIELSIFPKVLTKTPNPMDGNFYFRIF